MTKIPINKPKKEKKEDNKSYYFRWDLTRYSTKKFSPPGEKKATNSNLNLMILLHPSPSAAKGNGKHALLTTCCLFLPVTS